MSEHDLRLRRAIFESFAATGDAAASTATLRSLAEQHVVALDDDGQVWMAHPFAAHHDGARVDAGGRTWWGNCAWDGFGIVAALGLERGDDHRAGHHAATSATARSTATPSSTCSSPPRHWWDDIGFT